MKKKTFEQFVAEANLKHNNYYDYSESKYINTTTDIKILCPKHGYFNQKPKKHLAGQGCPKCGNLKRANKRTKLLEQFIKEAKEIHDDKYDYSLVEYKNCKTKIKIICPKHGIFEQEPGAHIYQKQGCPFCKREKIGELKKKPLEEFIKDAKIKFGDKFNYSLVQYINERTEVKIICPEHGITIQTPLYHLTSEFGCQKCSRKYSPDTKEFIEKSKLKFGNRFDYSETVYKNRFSKIKLKCIKHNLIFETYPYTHLQQDGCCKKCKSEKISNLLKLTQEEFIKRVSLKHNNEYDYSNTKYISSQDNIH